MSATRFVMLLTVMSNSFGCGHRGGRGLRQGGPMSPYLFTIVMEVLNLIILRKINSESVKTIKLAMEEFNPNMSKSTMFCSNLSDAIKNEILGIVPFNVGKLPVRYLGVPLVTRRLSVKDCKSLVEKVKGKVGDWKNKFLSYAGRMQLIASVLSAMQTYWAFVFFIPKTNIKEIDSILKSFLWS
ncbi:hypothetical protein Tco_1464157 [Tanacetum coccineum]